MSYDWIITNHLGRRNLSPEQASFLRGKRYNLEKTAHGGNRLASGHNVHLKTEARLAKEYQVNPRTIRRDGQFASAVETLAAELGAGVRDTLLSHTTFPGKQDRLSSGARLLPKQNSSRHVRSPKPRHALPRLSRRCAISNKSSAR